MYGWWLRRIWMSRLKCLFFSMKSTRLSDYKNYLTPAEEPPKSQKYRRMFFSWGMPRETIFKNEENNYKEIKFCVKFLCNLIKCLSTTRQEHYRVGVLAQHCPRWPLPYLCRVVLQRTATAGSLQTYAQTSPPCISSGNLRTRCESRVCLCSWLGSRGSSEYCSLCHAEASHVRAIR